MGLKLPESSLVYRKYASPNRVDEVATLSNHLDSDKFFVCTRSGAKGGFTPRE
ncbi:hypothetical protein [uncultured Helicobacter sp.]|uniref:hypothetical protein n=1 Tax=uncultured Helicobacter sp. TaxID=175537 RepID=UPI00374EF189